MKRKIFIDCGGHDGCSIRKFTSDHEGFECYTFEPNPVFERYYKDLPTKLIQKVVWIEDGPIKFYIGGKYYYESSSVYGNKFNVDKNNYIETESVNLGKWIKENFSKDDYIVLKMDIECAEYEVLRSMLNDGSIDYVNELFAEFHFKKHKLGVTRKEHDEIISSLKKKIIPKYWDALEFQIMGKEEK